MFNKEVNKFMRRWHLLTAYAHFVQAVSHCGAGPVQQMGVIYLVTNHLEDTNDETPMDMINYVVNTLCLDEPLPEVELLVDMYVVKEK